MVVIHLLFLTLHILSAEGVRQHAPTTRQGMQWLRQGRSVLVGLETPDLPLWNPEERIGENVPTALLFNFTLTFDSRILLLVCIWGSTVLRTRPTMLGAYTLTQMLALKEEHRTNVLYRTASRFSPSRMLMSRPSSTPRKWRLPP
jgi:hypothetical protein